MLITLGGNNSCVLSWKHSIDISRVKGDIFLLQHSRRPSCQKSVWNVRKCTNNYQSFKGLLRNASLIRPERYGSHFRVSWRTTFKARPFLCIGPDIKGQGICSQSLQSALPQISHEAFLKPRRSSRRFHRIARAIVQAVLPSATMLMTFFLGKKTNNRADNSSGNNRWSLRCNRGSIL